MCVAVMVEVETVERLFLWVSVTLAETVGFGDIYVHHPLSLRRTVSQAVYSQSLVLTPVSQPGLAEFLRYCLVAMVSAFACCYTVHRLLLVCLPFVLFHLWSSHLMVSEYKMSWEQESSFCIPCVVVLDWF